MLLNQCGAETTIEDSMEGSSSMFVYSYLTKRKAEFDPEELEESDDEYEELGDEKVKIDDREEHEYHSSTNSDHSSVDYESDARKRKAEYEPGEEEEEESDEEEEGVDDGRGKIEEEPIIDYLEAPEWDVDSFDGLEYYSSPEVLFSSEDEPFSEESKEHYRIFKRQMIESKGFYGDPKLRPFDHFRGIKPMGLEWEALTDKDFRGFFEELVYFCLLKLNQDQDSNVEFVEVVRGYYRAGRRSKSYITFMAREKPDGPLVEYQAKCMVTLDRKRHPILCRPAPTPKL